MGPQVGSSKQPKRRGRPPKRHQALLNPVEQQPQLTATREQGSVVGAGVMLAGSEPFAHPVPGTGNPRDTANEQLTYSQEEEQLSTFSSFLRHILRHDREEIARVANELGVSENTIYRWMNGNSEPRSIYLKNLIEALPEHFNNLTSVINQTFPGVLDSLATGLREVQKDIYRRILEIAATTIDANARRWQITQAIFEDALLHLDSERQGLAITYAKLMPARPDGIHSLCESVMRGNHPWPFALENHAYLGSTTLAGTAATLERMQTWDNLDESERLQFQIDDFERSACAHPVTHAGRIAGVLIISSAQPGFFANPVACQTVVEYAQLLALGFPDTDFYPFSMLNLVPMPDLKWQRAEVSRSHVNRIITYARRLKISRQEAELLVRADIEKEFEEIGRQQYEQRLSKEETLSKES